MSSVSARICDTAATQQADRVVGNQSTDQPTHHSLVVVAVKNRLERCIRQKTVIRMPTTFKLLVRLIMLTLTALRVLPQLVRPHHLHICHVFHASRNETGDVPPTANADNTRPHLASAVRRRLPDIKGQTSEDSDHPRHGAHAHLRTRIHAGVESPRARGFPAALHSSEWCQACRTSRHPAMRHQHPSHASQAAR